MRGLQATDTPGLFKHESGSYWGRISVAGKQRYKSFRTVSKTDARTALARWRKDLELKHAQSDNEAGKNDHRSVGYFLGLLKSKYAKRRDIGEREANYCRERIRGLFLTWPELFRIKAANLTKSQVEDYKHRCLDKRAASTTRGNLLFLRLALDLAVERGVVAANPMAKIDLPTVSRAGHLSAKHQLSEETFDIVIEHMRKGRGLSRRASELAELMAYTGLRVSEARNLVWGNVDWKRKELDSHNAKGRRAKSLHERRKVLPFFPRLEDLLIRLRARYGESPASRLIKVKECVITLENACEAVGVPRLTQQDLRHLFTTWSIEAGVDIPTVADWLGHTDGGALLMMRYRHHRRQHSQKQALKLSAPASSSATPAPLESKPGMHDNR